MARIVLVYGSGESARYDFGLSLSYLSLLQYTGINMDIVGY